ncbi:MAG: ribonuclease H family protein [Longimicrobiales bacterium]
MCDESFSVPVTALEKYPDWEPKYCRAHSPQKKAAKAKSSKRKAAGGSSRKRTSPRKGGARGSSKEEILTLDEVLAKYVDGPQTGVFTDGSSYPNPGPGGWGFVWVEAGEIAAQGHGAEAEETTNNRMELTALIQAFQALPEDASVTVFSDSQLCVNTITKWAPGWERNGWKRKGSPLKNLDLVKELLSLYRAHPDCSLEWMRAHAGYRWNEYADSLASAWRRDEL